MIRITTTYDRNEYAVDVANLEPDETRNRISIHINGFWAGSGRWNDQSGMIEECSVIYDENPAYVTEVYAKLSAAIREAMSDDS